MFIPEFICGVIATILIEIVLLVIYTIYRSKNKE